MDTTWLASGPESVSGLADADLESELWVKDVRYGQNAFSSGYEFARTGRRTLLSFDLRTAFCSRAVDDLSLQVGTETVAPVSSGYVARRRYPAGEGARTLDFIPPPGTGAEIPFTLNQRRPDGTTVPLHQGGYRQRGAPTRPLRIGLKLMTITGKEGEPLRYLIPASGADLGFSMPMLPMMFDGLSLDSRTGVVAGTPSYAHAEAVMLTVTNSAGRAQAVLRIAILANAAPPEITSATEALGGAGLGFSHQIQAVNSPQSYLASNLPPDLVLNELTGVISGTPLNAGVYQVVLGASNSFGVGRQTLTLTVASSSQPPSFARMLDTSAELGKPFVYDLARFCANNPVQWGIQDLPPGLALAPATGQITGTPLAAGFYSPTVTVRNVVGPTSVQFVFVVSTPHGLPVLVNPGILSGTVGREFQYRIQASGAPTGYGATGLPDNLAVDPRSGQISGKPGVPGRFRTLLSASNPIGNGGAEVIVDILANPAAPLIGAVAFGAEDLGATFDFQPIVLNGGGGFTAAHLPEGLSVDRTTGRITGRFAKAGRYVVDLAATNAFGPGGAQVHLRVVPNLNGWLAVAGLTGESALPSADPDQDGAPNLVEYAFDSDATVPMDQPLVRVELDAHGQPAVVYRAWSESVGNLLTDYEAGGVRYEMETSSTAIGPWVKSADAFDANVSLMETTDGTRQLGLPLHLGAGGRSRFVRLRVSQSLP